MNFRSNRIRFLVVASAAAGAALVTAAPALAAPAKDVATQSVGA